MLMGKLTIPGNFMLTTDVSNSLLTLLSLVEDLDDLLGSMGPGLHVVLLLGGSEHLDLASYMGSPHGRTNGLGGS